MKLAAIVVCKLNSWTWPEELGEAPDWVIEKFKREGRERYEYEKEAYSNLIETAKRYTTAKEISKTWNCEHRQDPNRMTPEQFEEWWNTHYG